MPIYDLYAENSIFILSMQVSGMNSACSESFERSTCNLITYSSKYESFIILLFASLIIFTFNCLARGKFNCLSKDDKYICSACMFCALFM